MCCILCMLLLYIYAIARDSLLSIAVTLAMNIFLYCMYTPKTLNIELVKVIRMILDTYDLYYANTIKSVVFPVG